MNLFDAIVILLLLFAAFAGARAGFFGPVLGLAGAVGGFAFALFLASVPPRAAVPGGAADAGAGHRHRAGRVRPDRGGARRRDRDADERRSAGQACCGRSTCSAAPWSAPPTSSCSCGRWAACSRWAWLRRSASSPATRWRCASPPSGCPRRCVAGRLSPSSTPPICHRCSAASSLRPPRSTCRPMPRPRRWPDPPWRAPRASSSGCGAGLAVGSGFFVSATHAVTNAHVVAGSEATTVTLGGATFDAVVVAFDDEADLALLHVAGAGARPLQLASSTPTRDDRRGARLPRRGRADGDPGRRDRLPRHQRAEHLRPGRHTAQRRRAAVGDPARQLGRAAGHRAGAGRRRHLRRVARGSDVGYAIGADEAVERTRPVHRLDGGRRHRRLP